MTDTPNDLLAAVDALTKPVALIRWQETGHDHEWVELVRPITVEERAELKKQKQPLTRSMPTGEWSCLWCDEVTATPTHNPVEEIIRRRTEVPLLDQLREAVASDKGQSGGRKPGREQVPIDIAALTLYEMIDGRIRSWLDELGARPGKAITPTQALRTWYTLWAAGEHVEGLEVIYRAVVEGWAQQVRDKLAPPKRIEITAPCPICGKEWINVGLKLPNGHDDPEDVEMVRVLNAVERESLDESYALCQACSTVWLGVGRMRQLRIDIDDRAVSAETAS